MSPRLQSTSLWNLATMAGMGMIIFSIFLDIPPATLFPGPSALLLCVGSALIIGAGEAGTSIVSVLLSLRPFVFIGTYLVFSVPVALAGRRFAKNGDARLRQHHHVISVRCAAARTSIRLAPDLDI
jgi:hypothetical protein